MFGNSSDVSVINCAFYLPADASVGILINHTQGDVVVQGCTFKGSSVSKAPSRGLYVIYGEGGLSTVTITGCDFREFYADPLTRNQENFRNARSTLGQGLVLLFNELSSRHTVIVHHCHFTENFAVSGSTLLVVFDWNSQQNSVIVSECQFIRNRNLYGAIGIYYWGESSLNNVTIRSSNFSSNTAYEGGAIFAAFLSQKLTNVLTMDNCKFENNTANEGAAVHLFNSPTWFVRAPDINERLVSVNISDCLFTNNTALGTSILNAAMGTEGIFNALRIRLHFSNTKYIHTSVQLVNYYVYCVKQSVLLL